MIERALVRVESSWGARTPAGPGWSLGVQIYDPDSGRFLEEGRWRPMPDSGRLEEEFELPAQPGDYRLYVAPVHEVSGWAYERGQKFLVVDARVENGAARVLRSRWTTLGALRRQRWAGACRDVFSGPWRTMVRHRALLTSLVRRDVAARYRGSFGDLLWSLLNPLLLMAAYLFVFGFVLRARFAGDPSAAGFALYFLAGMIPWLAFSEALGRSPQLLVEHRNFVKKILFPVEVLPVQVTLAGLVTPAVALVFYLAGLAVFRDVPVTAFWLPAIVIPQVLFTLGLSWMLAAAGVFLRDLVQVTGFLLTLWFFLTPICYPEASLPAAALDVLRWNPMLHVARAWRAVLLEAQTPSWRGVGALWGFGILTSFVGYAVFYKLRKSLADVL